MQGSKTYLLNPKILFNVFRCGLHTSVCSPARGRKRNVMEDLPFETHLSDIPKDLDDTNEYATNDDINFMARDLHETEVEGLSKSWRRKINFKITKKKFFSSPPEPKMLTYNEKMCIKHLHNEDPLQWDIQTLSESFPATRETIQKVLRSNWKLTPQKILKMDTAVQKNWELLAEGKLDAPPETIEHLKKFINRRETLLQQLQNETCYLPVPKKEVQWNGGEMVGILKSYEKSIKRLEKKQVFAKQETEPKLIESSEITKNNGTCLTSQEERFNNETVRNEWEESNTMDKILKHYIDQQTSNKSNNLSEIESAIKEHRLKKRAENSYKENNTVEGLESQNTGKKQEQYLRGTSRAFPKQFFKRGETGIQVDNKFNERETPEFEEEDPFTRTRNLIGTLDKNTILGNELSVGKILEKKMETEPKKEIRKVKKSVERFNQLAIEDPERLVRDAEYYNKEVDDIKNTAFWNGKESDKPKMLIELEKGGLRAPKDADQVTVADIASTDVYPERIKIPKSKRGTGLTFKVKDCYYDDDGEFLYRVPGMVN